MCHWGKLSYVESDGEPEIAGRYRLTDRIGHGGMGTVWLAEDGLLGRRVAVKRLRLPPQLDDDERARLLERTRREARSAARISHPNVIVVHDVVEDSGLPCIVMEYVPARSLGDALKEQGPLSPDAAVRTALAMTSALRAAHAAGVLHRDVKPANVLLSEEGARPVLTDFGIAAASGTATLTRTGEFVGSMAYTAPERFHGADSTPAADVWALGATLYEAVEGRTPFERDTWLETAYAAATEEPHPMQRAGVLAPVLERLLAKDPEERPALEEAERLLRDAYGGGRRTEEHTQVPAPAPESATGAAAGATAGSAAGAAPGTAAGSATGSATGSEATTTYGRGEHHGRNSAVSAPSPAAAGTSVEEPVTAHGSTTGHGSATGHGHGSTPGNPGDPAHAGTHTGPGYTRHTPGAQPSQPSHNSGPGYGAGPVPVLDDGSATGGSAVAGDPHGTVVRPPGKPRRRGARVLAWSAAVAVVGGAPAPRGGMVARHGHRPPEPPTTP
ncbi:serine/threonine-protein kinase, partial [Streptomyces sp. ODS28]|uniref:serine/threonine-protein kinase n=1 Tax=Streptomyces sp. ODS28 TaxID=3136688 RepID=UPI0031EDA5F9